MKISILLLIVVLVCLASQQEQDNHQTQIADVHDPEPQLTQDQQIHQQIQNTDSEQTYETEEDRKLMEEWDKHMHDFTPADMITTTIQPYQKEHFFEQVTQIPSYIRGAFFIENDSENTDTHFDFKVVDPRNVVLSQKVNKKEGLFYFNVTTKGVYTFQFDNSKSNKEKQYSFAVHLGRSSETELKKSDINPLQQRVDSLDHRIQEAQMKEKVIHNRFDFYLQGKIYTGHQIGHGNIGQKYMIRIGSLCT